MRPYYQQDGITIYHGDCLDVLPSLCADAVVTDAPFGISDAPMQTVGGKRGGVADSNTWHPESEWDHAINPEWGALCCAAAPVVAWFGHWRKRPEVESSMSHPLRCELVWAKDCHVGPPCPAAMRDERIWLFARDGLKPTRFETTVWDAAIIPTWEHKWHKNQKPEALMLRLLSWLMSAGSVIDPFMGSGTTLVAAKRLGLKAVGIDISERYCEIAVKRLAQGALPLTETA